MHNPASALKSARIGRKDRAAVDPFSIQDAETLIAAIHRDWGEAQGNYDEFRFFTGLRPSEQIALVVTDFDAINGVISVTKARVAGVNKDVTKTREDRQVVLCPRALQVVRRQLRLRQRLHRAGPLRHDYLFVTELGQPLHAIHDTSARWRRTLRRLSIRYRRPYTARHSSVSWDLMLGRNPLWVAKQHGHSLLTMLRVYAAWAEGMLESQVTAIRKAMGVFEVPEREARTTENERRLQAGQAMDDWPVNWPVTPTGTLVSAGFSRERIGGADGTRTRDPRRDRPVF